MKQARHQAVVDGTLRVGMTEQEHGAPCRNAEIRTHPEGYAGKNQQQHKNPEKHCCMSKEVGHNRVWLGVRGHLMRTGMLFLIKTGSK